SQVLTTLWDERGHHGFQLTKQGYEAAGRVSGALRRQADEARQQSLQAGGDAQTLDLLLLQLAHLTEQETYAGQRARLPDLCEALSLEPTTMRRLLEPFVQRRLLVTGEEGETETIEVAHEKLLSAWPYLAELLKTQKEELTPQQEGGEAGVRWEQSGRRRELWSDATSRLSRAEELLSAGRLH